MLEITGKAIAKGKESLVIFLDNASQHKKKMKAYFYEQLDKLAEKITITFEHIPPYSPKMNVAEYSIQLIRKKYLKNLPVEMTLEQREEHLVQQLSKKEVMNGEQIKNVIKRIKRVPI